jgi:hypothetical protein
MKKSSREFKELQRERILKTKTWLKSTGAKTLEGREKSKMNALKCNLDIHKLLMQSKELFKQSKEIKQCSKMVVF